MSKILKVYIVSYCTDQDLLFLGDAMRQADLLIGVDQGVGMLIKHGFIPDYAIGDFDSLDIRQINLPEACKIIHLPTEKDETDLEYALNYVQKLEDPAEVIMINSLQGRIDHTLSAVYLLEGREQVCLVNAHHKVFLPHQHFYYPVQPATTVSLLPLSETVTEVWTKGLYYPLQGETLHRNQGRGLSNKSVDSKVEINFLDGKLLIIVDH